MSVRHGPGVACIVVGVKDAWGGKNNGRVVVIRKLSRVSPKKGAYWRCAAMPGDEPLYTYVGVDVGGIHPTRLWTVTIKQVNLIPIAPEQSFNEQITGTEADNGEFILL